MSMLASKLELSLTSLAAARACKPNLLIMVISRVINAVAPGPKC